MSGGKEYAVVLAIRAADYASGTIRAVVGRLAAIRGQVAALGRSMGLAPVMDALSGVRAAAGNVAGHLRGVLAPALGMTGLMSATSALGLWSLTRSAANGLDKLGEYSDRTGIAAQRLRELQFAAQRAGASNEDLESGLNKLNTNIGQAVNGTGKGKEVFAALGISLKDAAGKVKTTDAVMMELADKMAKIPDASQRAAVASVLLGKQAGVMLAPMLAKGTAGMEEWFATARKFGTVSDEAVQAASDFNDAMDDAERAAGGLGRSIGAKLMPHFTPLIKGLTDWIIANKALLTQRVEELVKRIAAGLQTVDWTQVVNGVFAFIDAVQRAVAWVGGWKNVMIGVAVAMAAGPIMSTLSLVSAVAQLGWVLGGVAVKFALAFGGGVVGMIVSLVTALRSGLSVMMAINIAMTANPIGAIIVGITALVALGIYLYNTWEPFRKMIDWIVDKVASLAKGAVGWVVQKLGIELGSEGGGEGGGAAAPPSAPIDPPAPISQAVPADIPAPPPAMAPQASMAPPPAMAPQATIAPPAAVSQSRSEVTVRILSDAPAKVEGVRQQGAGLTVRTDLDTGRGRAATG